MTEIEVREQVRERYAAAALAVTNSRVAVDADGTAGSSSACRGSESPCGGTDSSCGAPGSSLYDGEELQEISQLPPDAVAASLGCGNPLAVAQLRAGDWVLDLGSGGGIDVLLSARRVGPTGFVYGLDMTDEMLDLARANASKADAANVEFLKGTIEDVPLPSGSVDVVISNCVVNLSVDKPAVLAEMFRVLTPGGRVGISDIVAEDDLDQSERAARGSYVGCIAGALSRREYLDGLAAAGFVDADVEFTHEAAPQIHGAIVRARRPS